MDNNLILSSVQVNLFLNELQIKKNMWLFINNTIFRLFPTWLTYPRILLLRVFGAELAKTVNISRTATICQPWNLEMNHLSSIGANSYVCCIEKVKIGERCRIASNVNLATQDQSCNDFSSTTGITVIANGCWISAGSCIRRGVKLGEYTMVGAYSVVMDNTEPFSIVSGNPAKVIKKAIVEF